MTDGHRRRQVIERSAGEGAIGRTGCKIYSGTTPACWMTYPQCDVSVESFL
jgi:hypothetical protein